LVLAYFFGATLYIDFAHIGTSNAAADDVTNSHIKYLLQAYNLLVRILYSKVYEKM